MHANPNVLAYELESTALPDGSGHSPPAHWRRCRDLLSRARSAGFFGGIGGVARRQFPLLISRLDEHQRDLHEVAREIEERFVATGSGVRELTALSDSLLEQSHRLAGQSGGCEAHLHAALKLIRQQLELVAHCQESNARLIGSLEGYCEKTRAMEGCETNLARILTPLHTAGILFKIQSVSLGTEEHGFFAAITRDIESLQAQARMTLSEQMQGLLETGRSLSSAIPRLREQSRKQGRKLAEKRDGIEASLRSLQTEVDQMKSRHARLSQAGKGLSSATGTAVVSLQYQDITRQKWEHVAEAVREMSARMASYVRSNSGFPPTGELVFLRDVSRVQSRQLQAIQEDLARAQSAIGGSLDAMLEHLRRMDEECQPMCRQEAGSGAVERLVEVLLGALSEVRNWVAEFADTARTTSEAVGSFDRTLSDVAGTLRRLSANINLIAINAQVQSARIGNNGGLGITSEFTCGVARDIHSFSGTVGAEFDRLVQGLHETIIECRTLREKALCEQQWLEGQGRQHEEKLRACRDEFSSVLKDVGHSLRQVHEQATCALRSLDFHWASQDGFRRLQATLEECAVLAGGLVGSEATLDDGRRGDELLHASYTMESERVVHASVVEGSLLASRSVPSVLAARSGSGSGLARTDETPPAGADGPKAIPFPAMRESVAPAAPTPGFGDNVELF